MKYKCRKCGLEKYSFEIFQVSFFTKYRYYCLNHIPKLVKFKMWFRGVE